MSDQTYDLITWGFILGCALFCAVVGLCAVFSNKDDEYDQMIASGMREAWRRGWLPDDLQ